MSSLFFAFPLFVFLCLCAQLFRCRRRAAVVLRCLPFGFLFPLCFILLLTSVGLLQTALSLSLSPSPKREATHKQREPKAFPPPPLPTRFPLSLLRVVTVVVSRCITDSRRNPLNAGGVQTNRPLSLTRTQKYTQTLPLLCPFK